VLIVELADSSLDYDRGVKHRLYARGGLREYWVVDVNREVVQVCRLPEDGVYGDVSEHTSGATLAVPGVAGASLAVAAVFG
jgi:Uma2 family endonuclease